MHSTVTLFHPTKPTFELQAEERDKTRESMHPYNTLTQPMFGFCNPLDLLGCSLCLIWQCAGINLSSRDTINKAHPLLSVLTPVKMDKIQIQTVIYNPSTAWARGERVIHSNSTDF